MEHKEAAVRVRLNIPNGVVLIGSDAHYWPRMKSTAHKAFVAFAKEVRPKAIILNGDIFDGASISRHPAIGWERRPTVIEELGAVAERLKEIEAATPKAHRIWTLGNHDMRFETRLASLVPEYERVKGLHLKDHFDPSWVPAWACHINEQVVVKHRFKGGTHAAYGNAVHSGKSIITGHLHSLQVTAVSDYNGTRWGIDSGTLADPYGPQFSDWTEDNPVNWRSGFVFLTFSDGQLLWPEVVPVIGEGKVSFRGEVVRV